MAVTKVFKIELSGGSTVQKDVQAIKKEIVSFARSTKDAKAQLALLFAGGGDEAAIQALQKNIADLERKMRTLGQQHRSLESDAKAQAQAEKLLAEVLLKEAQAQKVLEQANLARTQSQIAQEKELDRQIAAEAKEQAALEKKKRILDALPGSYNAIRNALNQLRPQIQSGNENSLINFGGQQISFDQAIAEFKTLSAAEQEFRRQFSRDGTLVGEYSSGIVDAFRKLNIDDIIRGQVTGAKEQLDRLEKETNDLVVAYRAAQTSGAADLNKLEKEIHDNVVETEKLKSGIKQTETQLRGMGGIGDQITSSLDRNFKSLKNSVAQFALGFVGFQAILSGLQNSVEGAKQLSDQTTELEIQLGKTAGGASQLVSELAKLDTRTKLTVLEEIANIALRAGTAEENLLGVTKAIDTVKTAFGKDFGGIEEGTETFVKLINIFFDDGEVTEDRILKIGNAIRQIANESVASVPFINDFSGRMAGVKQIANVTLPQIIGLGAGFEEFKQSAEVSSTVLVKLIPLMAKNLDKFAEVAGVTREEFKKLIDENPIEAILQLSEGLQKSGDIEGFSKSLGEIGVEAGRATTIIATLGGKADIFRQRIQSANGAIESTDAITVAFNQKNENLAATLDKVGKKFADAAGGKGFQTTLLVIGSAISFLIDNLGILITIFGSFGVVLAIANAQLIQVKLATFASNLAFKAQYAWLLITEAATKAYAVAQNLLSAALLKSAASSTVLNTALKLLSGPLGIILTIIGFLTISFAAFGKSITSGIHGLSELARQQRINVEINRAASASISDQVSKLDGWIAVIKSATTSADTKRRALDELIKLNPKFRDALQGQTLDLQKLDEIYVKIVKSIQAKARAEAAATLSAEKQKRVAQIGGLRQELEIEVARGRQQGNEFLNIELGDEQLELLRKTVQGNTTALVTIVENRAQILASRFNEIKKILDQEEQNAINVYKDYLTAQARAQEELQRVEDQVAAQQQGTATQVAQTFEVDIAKLKKQIEDLDEQINKFQGSKIALSKLIVERKKLQDQLDALLGKEKGKDKASKLTGDQKDQFKDIDAIRDRLLAEQQSLFLDLQIDEREYLQNVFKINVDAIDKKLAIIKGKNAEERKIIAQLNLEKINQEKETNKKLFDLDNKQLDINLRNQRLVAQRQSDAIRAIPGISAVDEIRAKEDFYNTLLLAQITFNQEQIALEKKYGIESAENEQKRAEAIEQINRELQETLRSLPQARLEDIRREGDAAIAAHNIQFDRATRAILENDKLSHKKRQNALEKLSRAQRRTILSDELKTLQKEFDEIEFQLTNGLASYEAYLNKKSELEAKAAQLAEDLRSPVKQNVLLPGEGATTTFLTDSLSNAFNFEEGGGEEQMLAQTIAQSYDLAFDAMTAFYDGQRARIEEEKQLELDKLDREKERLKATATSREEEAAIERQFAEKKKKVEKEAGEKLKKVKKAEAKIALATELANIAAAAAANPLNGVTLGAAGIIMYGILAGLAVARYALNVGSINREQFGGGGQPGQKKGFASRVRRFFSRGGVPMQGGDIGGKAHGQGGTPFTYKDRQYEAEKGELSIIRTRNAPANKVFSITGTHKQIASGLNQLGGGVSFASGAAIRKMDTGGQLGTNLRPPTFTNGYNSAAVNSATQVNNDMEELKSIVADLADVVMASDQKEVVVKSGNIKKAMDRDRKDKSVATI